MVLRCMIVDDSPRFLEAVSGLLDGEGIAVVAVAQNGDDAVRLATQLDPDVTLVDIELGRESGFDAVRRLIQEADLAPSTLILISTHGEEDYAERISASSAGGFLPKIRLSGAAIRDQLGLPS